MMHNILEFWKIAWGKWGQVFDLCQSKHVWLLSKLIQVPVLVVLVLVCWICPISGKIWSPNNFIVVVLSVHDARLICYVLDFKLPFNLVE
jgi:hypothetical protein